jgi:Sialic acid synthase
MKRFIYNEIQNFNKPIVIAELAANHNGDMNLAKELINKAKECGADYVKFQSWTRDTIFSKRVYEDNCFLSDDYRNRNDYTLKEIIDEFSVSENELLEMKKYCDEIGIGFSSTPFSKKEVDFLVDELEVDFIKIASMDLNNLPFLKYIATKGKPIVLSVGLSTLQEVDEAICTIKECGNNEIVILHCVSIYPPEDNEVNLNNIDMLRDLYKYPVGYSDHTLGFTAAILAIAKGACIIEKHFTLDKNMFGWDHKISANEDELRIICNECNRSYKMLGSYYKSTNESEERKNAFRRSIVAANNIKKGSIIREEDLDFKRPGTGIEPKYVNFIVGKEAKRDIFYDELIKMEDF